MKCKNVSVTVSKIRLVQGILVLNCIIYQFQGTLVLNDTYQLQLIKKPGIGKMAAIAVDTAIDNPDEVIMAALYGAGKIIMNSKIRMKTDFGRSVSRNIDEAIQCFCTLELAKCTSYSVSRCRSSIVIQELTSGSAFYGEGNMFTLGFPSESQAKRFYSPLEKLAMGKKPFIW